MDSSILWCNEMVCPVAQGDPVLNGDPRVLQQLIKIERIDGKNFRFFNNRCYFKEVQDEVQPHMRRILTKWMMEVSCILRFSNKHVDLKIIFVGYLKKNSFLMLSIF